MHLCMVPTPSHGDLRYVRQEDELWQELHAGVLTTGKLNNALGLREALAAQAISGPKVREPHLSLGYCCMHAGSTAYVRYVYTNCMSVACRS